MSKKMLKRSLALGALMAFVITGSAMAGETDKCLQPKGKIKSYNEDLKISGLGDSTPGIWGFGKVTVNGNLDITSGEGNAISASMDKDTGSYDTNELIITAKNIYLTTTKEGNGLAVASYKPEALAESLSVTNKKLTVNGFDSLVITSTGHGVNTTSGIGSSIDIVANDGGTVSVTASENAVYTHKNGGVDAQNTGNKIEIKAKDVTLDATAYSGSDEYKGYAVIAAAQKSTIKINATGNVDLDGVKGGVKAMNGSTVNITGNTVDIDVTATQSDRVVGVYSIGSAIDVTGTADIDVTNTGYAQGVRVENGGTITLDAIDIYSNSTNSEVDGLKVLTAFDSTGERSSIIVSGEAKVVANGKTWAQGVYSAYSEVLFKDNTNITATTTDNEAWAIAVRALADNSTPKSTVTFNNGAVLTVNGDRTLGVQASGSNPLGVQFDKGDIIVSSNGKSIAVGLNAAYNSGISASDKTNLIITASSELGKAYGIYNTYNADNNYANANINLLGNVKIIAKGSESSLAIYNEANNDGDCGQTIIGGLDKEVIIDGDIKATGGVVTTTFGAEGSKFDGKVETVEKGTTTLNFAKGATWNLKGASTLTNATFDAGSTLVIDGKTYEKDKGVYALNGVGENATLNVTQGAKLTVEGIDYNTYNIAKGFSNIAAAKDKWDVTNLNTLMQGVWTADATNGLQLEVVAKEADQMATEMGVSSSTAQSLNEVTTAAQNAGVKGNANGTGTEKAVALVEAMAKADSKVAGQAFEAVSKMAEAGGNSGTAASIVKNVTGVTNDRLSFNCGHSAPHKGGHGVGLLEEGSGADIWVEYVHGKDEVEDMPSTAGASSYEGQYNGIVMGLDFKKVNKFQSGIAFNYGEGDTNSVGSAARTHSDYDFWGIGYYGSIHNDDSNVIFDIGYAKTDSDVETKALGLTYNASPETTTWTAGVKVEKLYQNENVQIVPYTGLRFMSIDPEDYSTECASSKYDMERQNVWLLPLGVSIRQEIANDNGWTVSPKVDLSYIWAFGDTDSEMEFSTLGTKTNIGYEVMDDGSFLGLVGIEAHKGQWGFGVSYSYQKGDYSTSKKWFIDANYSF